MDRKRLLLLTLLAALVVAAVIGWRGERERRVAVAFAEATRGPISREILTSGTLEPAREVEVGAQVSGTVQSVEVDYNDRVSAGQVLARLDPSTFDTEVAQARGRLIQANADVEAKQVARDDARTKALRARELRAQDLINQAELDAAELALREADANLAAAQAAARSAAAALASAEVDRSRTIIRSPIDGVVVNRTVEVGQTLASRVQTPVLFRVADLRQMHMLTEVGEAEVSSVRQGSDVRFVIESLDGREFHGTVAEVRLAPVLQAGSANTPGRGSSAPAPTATTGTPGATGATATSGTAATPGAGGTSGTPGTTGAAGTTSAAGAAGTSASAATATSASNQTVPAGSVVSYTAVVNVDNEDYRIAPGTTAIVTLPTAQRSDVLRIANNALSFRPPSEVLEAAGQRDLAVAPDAEAEADPSQGRTGYVWKFENGKFMPVEVRTGASDETWTEVLNGAVQPGDRLVVTATIAR